MSEISLIRPQAMHPAQSVVIDYLPALTLDDLRLETQPVIRETTINTNATDIDGDSFGLQDGLFYQRTIFEIDWNDNNVEFGEFGGFDSGVNVGLAVGFNLEYNGKNIFPNNIRTNKNFGKYAFDSMIRTDGNAVTANALLQSRLTWQKFMPLGLKMDGHNKLIIKVNDDMLVATIGCVVNVVFEGWNFK